MVTTVSQKKTIVNRSAPLQPWYLCWSMKTSAKQLSGSAKPSDSGSVSAQQDLVAGSYTPSFRLVMEMS